MVSTEGGRVKRHPKAEHKWFDVPRPPFAYSCRNCTVVKIKTEYRWYDDETSYRSYADPGCFPSSLELLAIKVGERRENQR